MICVHHDHINQDHIAKGSYEGLASLGLCMSLHVFLFSEKVSQKHRSVIQAKVLGWAAVTWTGLVCSSKQVKDLHPSDLLLQCSSSFVGWVTIWNYCQVTCFLLSWANIWSIPRTRSLDSVYWWYQKILKSCILLLYVISSGGNVFKMDFFF